MAISRQFMLVENSDLHHHHPLNARNLSTSTPTLSNVLILTCYFTLPDPDTEFTTPTGLKF